MTFEKWLTKQKKRDDPIGDLSKDFIAASKFIDCKNPSFLDTFKYFYPCDGAKKAYQEALEEYKELK
jgi:hypothetical protein